MGETYYFALTAYDVFANESGFSTEVSTTISGTPTSTPEDDTPSSSEDQDTADPVTEGEWYLWLWNLLFGRS